MKKKTGEWQKMKESIWKLHMKVLYVLMVIVSEKQVFYMIIYYIGISEKIF